MWKKSQIGILILSCSLLLADISSCSFVLAKEESLVIQEENESNTAKEGQECDNIKDVDEEAEAPIQNNAEESEEEKELGNANTPAIEREKSKVMHLISWRKRIRMPWQMIHTLLEAV